MTDPALAIRNRSPWIAIIAMAAIVALALWQGTSSGAAFSAIEDWLASIFGQRLPAASVALLILVPIAAIFAVLAYRDHREIGAASDVELAAIRGERLLRVLAIATGTVVLAAIIVLLGLLTLPSDSGTRLPVDARTAADPKSGAVTLTGTLIRGRAVRYEKRIGAFSRTYQLVPVASAPADGGALRYFVELPEMTESDSPTHSGLLVRNGLPHDAQRAFEEAGYRVAEPNAVLFHDEASLRWPYFGLAVQLLIIAALLLLATTLQWFVMRRVRRAVSLLP